MTVDWYNPREEEFLEAVAAEEHGCPANCGHRGKMNVEPRPWGAWVSCPGCGAGHDVEPCESPIGTPRSALR